MQYINIQNTIQYFHWVISTVRSVCASVSTFGSPASVPVPSRRSHLNINTNNLLDNNKSRTTFYLQSVVTPWARLYLTFFHLHLSISIGSSFFFFFCLFLPHGRMCGITFRRLRLIQFVPFFFFFLYSGSTVVKWPNIYLLYISGQAGSYDRALVGLLSRAAFSQCIKIIHP